MAEHTWIEHLLTIAGFLLAVFLVARLMSEKRQPGNTVAWLLGIVLIPYVGVPLYLLFGGRKLRRLAARKSRFLPLLPEARPEEALANRPTVQALVVNGAPPPTGGNTIRYLTNGQEAYAALEEQIRAARHNIHLMTFILGRDDTGRRLVRLLAERARDGVKVRLLPDAVGCLLSSHGFVEPVRAAGGEVHRFMPVMPFQLRGSANLRNHRKIAVFDHHTAILGGHNLAREYMGPAPYRRRWRDFGAVIDGPAATLLNEVFIADWCFASQQSPGPLHREIGNQPVAPCGSGELQVVASGPDLPGYPLYEGIISMIQEANRSIWIITPYFVPDEVLFRSLLVKARAGKEVNLIMPARSNHPVTDLARRQYVRDLLAAGVKVHLYQAGMMHSKAMIVDDRIALMGSANFDQRSLFVNFEIGLFIHSEPDVQALRAWTDDLLLYCRSADPKKKSSFLGGLAEDVSRMLAPLL